MGRARIFLVLGLTACGGADPVEDVGPIRPTSTAVLTLDVSRYDIPQTLVDAPRLFVESNGPLDIVIGGETGLFRWEIDRFVSVSTAPVTAMAGSMIAADGELFVLDATFDRSPLTDELDGPVIAMAWRGEELWLATASAVYRYVDGELHVFEDLAGTISLSAFDGSREVIVERSGSALALRIDGTAYTRRDLGTEMGGTVVPGRGDRLLALDAGNLYERESTESGFRWRGVALDTDGKAATGLTDLLADPTTGATWTVGATGLHRIDGGQVFSVAIENVALEHRSIAMDGALWLGDGAALERHAPIESVGYGEHIVPFAEANCLRCHTALGTARPLDTYDAWVADIDAILVQLDQKKMPADGAPLVSGRIDLIQRWKAEGLLP